MPPGPTVQRQIAIPITDATTATTAHDTTATGDRRLGWYGYFLSLEPPSSSFDRRRISHQSRAARGSPDSRQEIVS
jgi:hypothetical protein